tara:strand:+ start:1196 stop:2134 length:939 start_codon:yes stop_codon:yes gene_type:complete
MSANGMIIKASDMTESHIGFNKPRINPSGGKNIGILNTRNNQPMRLEMPLVLTWGANEWVDDTSGKRSYDMALQFGDSSYAGADETTALNNVKMFESAVKQRAIECSKEWFNKPKMSEEVVDALFTPMLRYPKDKDTGEPDLTRSPTLKVKFNYWDDNFKCEVYDMRGECLFPSPDNPAASPISLITKGCHVKTIIQCGGVWFANGKFGVTWKLVQAMVKPKATLEGKCHITLTEDESQKLETSKPADDDGDDTENVVSTAVVDSDNDDNDDDEPTSDTQQSPEPDADSPEHTDTQTQPAKKRTVRKKKGEQ